MKKNNKGFTLAELLIVVAIIAVLVAIAIPIFSAQLEKSRDAVTASNIRAAYAEAAAKYLLDGSSAASKEQITISGVKIKGELSNGYFNSIDLPFKVSGVASTLDKGPATKAATFTWSVVSGEVQDTPTLSLG